MIDTHSHIQFKAFDDSRNQVIKDAKKAGVEKIIAVGTNVETSRKAIEVANRNPAVFASVGIHPHHVFTYCHPEQSEGSVSKTTDSSASLGMTNKILAQIETLRLHPKVVAIGETGIDKHIYQKTKYKNYQITDEFVKLQKKFFAFQIKLAIKYQKALIIHNRGAVEETLEVLEKNWDSNLSGRSVFHFCEPDQRLLYFAIKHHIFMGVDGDVLTDIKKQEFVKLIPLNLLVLETDSPFVSREPRDLPEILEFISGLLKINQTKLTKITSKNSLELFNLC